MVRTLHSSGLTHQNTKHSLLAAPYFQVRRKLLHVDILHEDEVPEADIGVYGHGGGVSLEVRVEH